MTFKEYINNAWGTHDTDARKILDEIKNNFKLMETEEDVMAMARLITHLAGEHLGDWDRGIDLLRKLKNNATINDKSEMNRLVAILTLGNFPSTDLSSFSYSDQARIYAMTSSALTNLGGLKNAEKFLKQADQIAISNFADSDPSHKVIAVASNNIACTLEEKNELSEVQKVFMIFAANLARKYWEKAGTWKEVERAEYRLAKTYLKVQMNDEAIKCAQECLKIVNNHNDDPLELFFAYEVNILANSAISNFTSINRQKELLKGAFDQLSIEDQEWCQDFLNKL